MRKALGTDRRRDPRRVLHVLTALDFGGVESQMRLIAAHADLSRYDHAFCAIADQKRFMAIYLMHYDLLIAFKNELKRFDCGKSCIRFKRIEPELMDLLDRVIKFTGSQMETSIHYGKPGNTRGSSGRLS